MFHDFFLIVRALSSIWTRNLLNRSWMHHKNQCAVYMYNKFSGSSSRPPALVISRRALFLDTTLALSTRRIDAEGNSEMNEEILVVPSC